MKIYKKNDTIPRKAPEDRRTKRWKEGWIEGWTDPISYNPSGYCQGSKKGNKFFVKWKGYDNSFNSWIDMKDIE